MKNIYFLIYVFTLVSSNGQKISVDSELQSQLQHKLLEATKIIKQRNQIPHHVIQDVKTKAQLEDFSDASQEWLDQDFQQLMLTDEISTLYSLLKIDLGDDITEINREFLVGVIRGKEVNVSELVTSVRTYWAENESPVQKLSPLGRNEIIWIWKMAVEDREQGVIHVGIDSKTLNFICYENTIGVYYPEGDRLKLIHSMIVQDSSRYGLIEWHLKNLNEPKRSNQR